jgi:hypothetical protein
MSLVFNAMGAIGTGVALVVVLLAKFTDGAWITLVLIPGLLVVFHGVKRHYVHVAGETSDPGPLMLSDMAPPIVVVPIKDWSTISERAILFGLKMSSHVIAVHISTSEQDAVRLCEVWMREVETPCRAASIPPPRLEIVSSPYRRVFTPLLDYVVQLESEFPARQIAVVIPELVESHWHQYLLHNQRATGLKAALLLRGGPRVVVVNVPWYLGRQRHA